MKARWTLGVLAAALAVAGPLLIPPASAASTTVTICHVPPGQRDQERTRQVDQAAVAALLANTASYPGACVVYGDAVPMGDGTLTTYAQRDGTRPSAIGVVFPRVALSGLPTSPSDGRHCYDVDGDGTIDPHDECVGGHESVLLLPEEFRGADDSPFQWILFNWNPDGHPPPAVYTVPHFDFHFFTMDLEDRNAIDEGPCALLVDCSDFQRATVPVPDQFLPQDYQDLGAVEAAMGNHLIDLSSPEFSGPFTHTFIYGAYDGHITFDEPMITKAWFEGIGAGTVPSGCHAMKLAEAYETTGWYPTTYCIRYRLNRDDYTVSLEGFVHRTATSG